ncbi:sigma factor-binding protein Crl [Vibrio scophthalmi]|uniref:sigma factor-binding protein Crl n=1 Tax=Vibrio scophthalmi TaxID=45658 RepID=UPI002FF02E95
MTGEKKTPTHFRLLTTLRAIGPYLREVQSSEGAYLFDCLSVCVNDKKSPEKREFWGWWLELSLVDGYYEARYRTGLYDVSGEWRDEPLPKKAVEDVTKTQEAFHQKLIETLSTEFDLEVKMHQQSVEFV